MSLRMTRATGLVGRQSWRHHETVESGEAANSEVTLPDALRALKQEQRERELAESRLRSAEERLLRLKVHVERECQQAASPASTFEGLLGAGADLASAGAGGARAVKV